MRILPSERNQQNRSRKWRYFSLGGTGRYFAPLKNREPEYTIADACLQGRIKEEGNQVKSEKQPSATLLPLAMPPTSIQPYKDIPINDFR